MHPSHGIFRLGGRSLTRGTRESKQGVLVRTGGRICFEQGEDGVLGQAGNRYHRAPRRLYAELQCR